MDINEQRLLERAAARGDALLRDRIVLYAGASMPSPAAQAAYTPALSAYPAMGPSFAKEQPDTDLVSELEVAIRGKICALLGANWAEPRLPSCTIANLAVFHAFGAPGALMLGPAAAHGGHLSQRRGGTPDLAGLTVEELPFDAGCRRLDAAAAAAMVQERRPALVLLGRSVMITPDDIAPVVASAQAVGAMTIFDASHVLGLIIGGTFPNPLALGVDVLTSSTYKTLPGRPHSVIAGRNPADGERLARLIDDKMLANYDAGRLPSLLVTLIDAERDAGDYARRICANSAVLAEALDARGVAVIAPRPGDLFTHQILIPIDGAMMPAETMKALERDAILVGTCADPTAAGHYALRIGTQFMTARGYGDAEFRALADTLARLLETTSSGRMAVRSKAD
ncbi:MULTISPECIES: glycine hydroxymethyltransferase [Rhodopseudomonas]|uniref:Glycine hydroxymethyltransferase n=1 Tax=Rhodopseudomonas palustris TaxID=1076 RepID=A0A0D7EME4_RHOPL|nr:MULTISPECIES: glycine hydroxymethyltransferase [Rhodopseudomonas]KIZ41973.1 glycine hydroxymethyltransferase [Rhodopseudomonas palustris]MDF3810331.1 glycine hydroxymethyltransferase [Rhodopseudomonas sp. BAL398]WOK20779.1 glycine hydroxymethyltransferase [Rhodopseudomonas sp. BAL398]